MLRTRIIPVLLLKEEGLVKGKQFKNHKYLGDPINAVRIFNEKEVDELIFLDISASENKLEPNFKLISDIASEAFMPFGYGGGVTSLDQVKKLFSIGVEKVIFNSSAYYNCNLITESAKFVGSQSIVVSIDVRKKFFSKYEVYVQNGKSRTRYDPKTFAKKMQDCGAGEIIICSIDREGTGEGYDLKLLEMVSTAVDIPVVGLGGASKIEHLVEAKNNTSISGLAAGDLFVFHGKHKAVLINYPNYYELNKLF